MEVLLLLCLVVVSVWLVSLIVLACGALMTAYDHLRIRSIDREIAKDRSI